MRRGAGCPAAGTDKQTPCLAAAGRPPPWQGLTNRRRACAHLPLLPPQPTSMRPSLGAFRWVLNWYSILRGTATCAPWICSHTRAADEDARWASRVRRACVVLGRRVARPKLARATSSRSPTGEGALSYFVGGDKVTGGVSEDKGFALGPGGVGWKKVTEVERSGGCWSSKNS